MRLHPITARNPTTCDYCHAPIAKHAMVYFARKDDGKYAIGCSDDCAKKLEQPQVNPSRGEN